MIKTDFLQWMSQKIEETSKHAYQREIAAPVDPKQGDLVITNPKGFMGLLITPSKGNLKNSGKANLDSHKVSKASVVGFKDGSPVIKSLSHGAPPRIIDKSELLDVTPAFEDGGLLSQLQSRQGVFIYNPIKSNHDTHQQVKSMWEKWWGQVARPQVAQSEDDLKAQAITGNLLGNTDAIKKQQRGLGNEHKYKQADDVLSMIRGFQSGNPVNNISYSELLNIMKGMTEDPYEVKWLRRNGYGEIVDALHKIGLSASVAGEEKPVDTLPGEKVQGTIRPLEKLNPKIIKTNPDELANRSNPPEDFWQKLDVAWYNPWKHNNDKKVYKYYD